MILLKTRTLLECVIATGIEVGWRRAHKHTDTPDEECIRTHIENAIWLGLDEAFNISDREAPCND